LISIITFLSIKKMIYFFIDNTKYNYIIMQRYVKHGAVFIVSSYKPEPNRIYITELPKKEFEKRKKKEFGNNFSVAYESVPFDTQYISRIRKKLEGFLSWTSIPVFTLIPFVNAVVNNVNEQVRFEDYMEENESSSESDLIDESSESDLIDESSESDLIDESSESDLIDESD
jgi:hypothetical protein